MIECRIPYRIIDMKVRKIHLPSRLRLEVTACGRDTQAVTMADEPDEGHATCKRCVDDWHFADVNGERLYE